LSVASQPSCGGNPSRYRNDVWTLIFLAVAAIMVTLAVLVAG
jgi:hypothetical protein